MAVLSAFKNSSILENNIVQTVASAAGTLSAIIFVLPGLVIVGWWTGFPFWTSFWICAAGGVLGVLFTIPLRRAMVTTSDLPYPEGVAAAEVLAGRASRRDKPPKGALPPETKRRLARRRLWRRRVAFHGCVRRHQHRRGDGDRILQGRAQRRRLRHGVFVGAVRRRIPGGTVGRRGDAAWAW